MVCDTSAIDPAIGFRIVVQEKVVVSASSSESVASSEAASSGVGSSSSTHAKTSAHSKSSTVGSIIGFTVLGIFTLAALPVTVMLGISTFLEFVGTAAIGTEALAGAGLDMGIISMMDQVTDGCMSRFVKLLAGVRGTMSIAALGF